MRCRALALSLCPSDKKCPKCGKVHNHPYYVETSEGFQDCPYVVHLTPAEVVNKMKVPTKKAAPKKEDGFY